MPHLSSSPNLPDSSALSDLSDVNQVLNANLPSAVRTIDRVALSDLDATQFAQRYQQRGVPVVMTGLLQPEWDWHLDYLREMLGDRAFLLRYYGRDRYQQDKRNWTSIGSGVQTQSQSFNQYADLIQSGVAQAEDIYLAKCSLQSTPLADTAAITTLKTALGQLGLQKPASSLNLWVGPIGHLECLHYDPMDGTLVQLHGYKRVVMFPPSQTFNLYPYPFYAHLRYGLRLRSWFSRVYPDRPDFEAFPRLRQAMQHKYELMLQPGEVLYIPAGWWHEISAVADPNAGDAGVAKSEDAASNQDMVCSVNRFWRVYPTQRAWFFWGRWRAYLGSACAVPNVLFQLIVALLSPDRQQKIKAILQML